MLQQLLWTEIILKGGLGAVLLLIPAHAAAVAGFPASEGGFWPRLVGAMLVALSGALLLQGTLPNLRTITPAGLITINLAGAATVVALQVLGKGVSSRRGRVLLWIIIGALGLLSLVEISFV